MSIPKSTIVYDCEIIRCIPPCQPGQEDLLFCGGWRDFDGMQISCICAYSFADQRYRVFLQDNLQEFETLVRQSDHVVGFNSLAFDDHLCAANDLDVLTTYDLLAKTWVAAGLPPVYTRGVTQSGYSLDALALANLGTGKSGSGALAPELWQRGKLGSVIDYCLLDVSLTVRLLQAAVEEGCLIDPTTGDWLKLAGMESA